MLISVFPSNTTEVKKPHKIVHIKKHVNKITPLKIALRNCSNSNPKACIKYVILLKHIGEPEKIWLEKIPGCESGFNPEEIEPSSHASGLYQFLPSTWEQSSNPYRNHWILSAHWNTLAASWLYEKDGDGREWSCSSILGLN